MKMTSSYDVKLKPPNYALLLGPKVMSWPGLHEEKVRLKWAMDKGWL